MQNVVCTLFEGHYHYGVAALVNSLYEQGFRGNFYAGFRGNLPEWASKAEENLNLKWDGVKTLNVSEELHIHFLPLNTNYHLTHYKPTFVLRLLNEIDTDARGMFYFDPDIVIKCNWNFFEEWISYGVALVHEITNHDMGPTHPVRQKWKEIILSHNKKYSRDIYSYINAGFFGLTRENIDFIEHFQEFINIAINDFGANVKAMDHGIRDRTNPFYAVDQDALNIAAMCCNSPISEIGPEGMDFIHCGFAMSHAVGNPKPWKKNYILSSLQAKPPSLADKSYWKNANGLIKNYSNYSLQLKCLSIMIASLIGRIYRRN